MRGLFGRQLVCVLVVLAIVSVVAAVAAVAGSYVYMARQSCTMWMVEIE